MDLNLTGRRAIVSGASRGIGLAVAEALAAEGSDVVLVARGKDALEAARERVARHGHRTLAMAADTTDDAAVRAVVAETVARWGGVDILVNTAAKPADPNAARSLVDLVDEDLRVEVETKVLGYLRFARAVAPHMIEQGWGRIINVAGLAARRTGLLFGSVRNVAVAAMTKNLADELGPYGVNVTVVHPGFVVTERTPDMVAEVAATRGVTQAEAEASFAAGSSIGRLITAAEVADVITFLASPRSVAVTGDAVTVGGGTPGTIYY